MATTIIDSTASRLNETYRETHNQLLKTSPEVNREAWQDYVGTLQGFDITDPSDQIQAKASLDALDQVLFASMRSAGGQTNTF